MMSKALQSSVTSVTRGTAAGLAFLGACGRRAS
jgi:hypothetical protein